MAMTQDLPMGKYGEDATVGIECSGWANYLDDDGSGDPWKYGFTIKTGSWDRDSRELSEFVDYEIEGCWGLLDMGEGAWIDSVSIRIGDDACVRKFGRGEEPLACELRRIVDPMSSSSLGGE